MSNPANQTCATCRYHLVEEPVEIGKPGDCRAHPPQVTMIPVVEQSLAGVQRQGLQQLTYWPKTQRDHWCGEWMGTVTIGGNLDRLPHAPAGREGRG